MILERGTSPRDCVVVSVPWRSRPRLTNRPNHELDVFRFPSRASGCSSIPGRCRGRLERCGKGEGASSRAFIRKVCPPTGRRGHGGDPPQRTLPMGPTFATIRAQRCHPAANRSLRELFFRRAQARQEWCAKMVAAMTLMGPAGLLRSQSDKAGGNLRRRGSRVYSINQRQPGAAGLPTLYRTRTCPRSRSKTTCSLGYLYGGCF